MLSNASNRLIRIHVPEFVSCCDQFIKPVQDVITEHNRYLQIGSKPAHFPGAGNWIDATGVRDHSNISIPHTFPDGGDEWRKIYGIPEIRIGLALLLQDRHRNLG